MKLTGSVISFDPWTVSGYVSIDGHESGNLLRFDYHSFHASNIRTLVVGQRVRFEMDERYGASVSGGADPWAKDLALIGRPRRERDSQ